MSNRVISNNVYQRLVDNSVEVRQDAMKQLRRELSAMEECSEEEMMKIWKGLYYCMWMSDKPRVQEELARTLASSIHMFRPKVAMVYYDCFLQTMCREFSGVDQYRKDKYYMLIRRCVESAFGYLRALRWDSSVATSISAAHTKVFKQLTMDGRITALFLAEIQWPSLARCFEQDSLFGWLIPKDAVVYSELEQPHIYIDTTANDIPASILTASREYLEPCPFEAFQKLFMPLLSLLLVTGDKGVKTSVRVNIFLPIINVLTRLLEHLEALQKEEDEEVETKTPENHPLDALTSTFVGVVTEFIPWLERNMSQSNIPVHALKPLVFFKEQLVALREMMLTAGVIEPEEEKKPKKSEKNKNGAKTGVKKTEEAVKKPTPATAAATTPSKKKKAAPAPVVESESEDDAPALVPAPKKQKTNSSAPTTKVVNPSKAKHTENSVVSKASSSQVFTPKDIPLGDDKKKKKVKAPYKK